MDTTAIYIERLEQAVRVMTNLSEDDRAHFDITVVAIRNETGVQACIAGHCGLDPWFQAEGLYTHVAYDCDDYAIGDLSIGVGEFFGTCKPFLRNEYPVRFLDGHEDVSAADAITALKCAIDLFRSRREAEAPRHL